MNKQEFIEKNQNRFDENIESALGIIGDTVIPGFVFSLFQLNKVAETLGYADGMQMLSDDPDITCTKFDALSEDTQHEMNEIIGNITTQIDALTDQCKKGESMIEECKIIENVLEALEALDPNWNKDGG